MVINKPNILLVGTERIYEADSLRCPDAEPGLLPISALLVSNAGRSALQVTIMGGLV